MGRRSLSGIGSVWFPLQVLHSNILKHRHHHLIIWINRLAATNTHGTCFALASIVLFFLPSITHEVDRAFINIIIATSLEQHMRDLTNKQFFPQTGVTETARRPLRLTATVAVLLLTMMSLLTGCGGGEGGGEISGEPSAAPVGITASLTWNPVQDPSIDGYFVYYGRKSPSRPGSCKYERSTFVTSPSATVTNLDPNTRYYFTVSAYNGLESPCSNEVSTVTDTFPVQTYRRSPSHASAMLNTTHVIGRAIQARPMT